MTAGIVGCWTVSQHRPRHGAGRRCWACRALGWQALGVLALGAQARSVGHARGRRLSARWERHDMGARAGVGNAGRGRRAGGRAGALQGAGRAGGRRAGGRRAGGRHSSVWGPRGRGTTAGMGRTAWALGARPVRTWACQLGARALGLVFRTGFRLGIFLESLNEYCSL